MEIIVALVIFAILAAIVAIGLHVIINTHKRLNKVDVQLQKLEAAETLLRRDISQIINRPINDDQGASLSAVVASNNKIEFTRSGFVNPLGLMPRSNLQRVMYKKDNNTLKRVTWSVLDRSINSKSQTMVVLNNMQDLKVQYVDAKGALSDSWGGKVNATNDNGKTKQQAIPHAVVLSLTLKH